MDTRLHVTPLLLAIVVAIIAIWSGLAPYDRTVWYAETIPIFAVYGLLILSYSRFQFSSFAYGLMSLWMILHFIGAKYTFANVPFETINQFLTSFLGEGRNHFDRIAHYAIGFYSYPMAEWLLRKRKCGIGIACCFSLFFIMSLAASYEIIEWQYAVIEGGEAGIEFLGSQGDIWDAQKDILADTLGALTGLILYLMIRPDLRLSRYY